MTLACVEVAFPGIPDEDAKEFVAERFVKTKSKYVRFTSSLSSENLAAMQDVLDSSVYVEARTCMEKTDLAKKALDKSLGTVQGAKSKTARKKLGLPKKDGLLSSASARPWLPNVANCFVACDDLWHFGWKVHYPRASAPFSHRVPFSAGTRRETLIACIKWAWNEHVVHGGEPCPFLLE